MEKLKEYFCVYLDILGYSNIIENKRESELENELGRFQDNVVPKIDFLFQLKDTIEFQIRIFSDNILICFQETSETINKISLIMSHIIDYQKSLIKQNYFIRGGISKGKLYIDKKTIWGPALIKAVKIEKSVNYPVIGISNNVLQTQDLINNSNVELKVPIVKVDNSVYFLDYLFTAINTKNNTYGIRDTFLQEHQRQIIKNLNDHNDERIVSKYVFLAKYHNAFCSDYMDKSTELKHYLITYLPKDTAVYIRKEI